MHLPRHWGQKRPKGVLHCKSDKGVCGKNRKLGEYWGWYYFNNKKGSNTLFNFQWSVVRNKCWAWPPLVTKLKDVVSSFDAAQVDPTRPWSGISENFQELTVVNITTITRRKESDGWMLCVVVRWFPTLEKTRDRLRLRRPLGNWKIGRWVRQHVNLHDFFHFFSASPFYFLDLKMKLSSWYCHTWKSLYYPSRRAI